MAVRHQQNLPSLVRCIQALSALGCVTSSLINPQVRRVAIGITFCINKYVLTLCNT